MRALRDFSAAFCTVCAVTGGLYMLCPEGAARRAVKYVFSLIFLICVVSAIPGLRSIRAEIPEVREETQITEEMRTAAARLTFEAALRNAGIEFTKISLSTDKSEDGSIKITKVTVASSASSEDIREALGGEDAAYTVEVIP